MEKDIKILKEFIDICKTNFKYNEEAEVVIVPETIQAIDNLLNRLEQDERVIEEMAKALKSYANLGVLIKCPAEYDGRYNYKNCKIDVTKNRTDKTNKLCNKCIIDHFRKKCE